MVIRGQTNSINKEKILIYSVKHIVRQSVKDVNLSISEIFSITHWNKTHESQCPGYFLNGCFTVCANEWLLKYSTCFTLLVLCQAFEYVSTIRK